jgi:hypothetical protein
VGKSLRNLPAGIHLAPGRVTVEFVYPEDFWALMDELADIAAQDPHGFEQAVAAALSS